MDKTVDPDRPLSKSGRSDVTLVGQTLQTLELELGLVWHSGKTRAAQTAELLLPHVAPAGRIEEVPGLAPEDPAGPIASKLARQKKPLLIVGHLPHLDRLASLLITGREDGDAVHFQKGAVLCLEPSDAGKWAVAWMVTPELAQRQADRLE